MEQIKDILPGVMRGLAQTKPDLQAQVSRCWRDIAGEPAGQHTTAAGIRDGKLIVMVDSPVWLFQMNIQKKKTLGLMQKKIPEVSDITFKIGKAA